jgi:hypothetical protein
LSEDLDFDYEGQLDTGKLKSDLIDYFSSSLCLPLLDASLKGKKDKIYLKFPILKGLNLAYGRSHVLYLKIEPALCPVAPKTVEITTINRDGLYFFVRRYSLADLMSGKIHAFLTRAYFKGKENEIDFKGRDLFDLVWYMGQNILPNLERLQILLSDTSYAGLGWRTLLDKIGEKIKKMGKRQIVNDIQQFIETPEVLEQFLLNYFCVFEQYRKNLFPSPK